MADDSPTPELTSRQEALTRGLTHYRGKPCKNDHDGKRYTSTGTCCACNDARNLLPQVREQQRIWALKDYKKRSAKLLARQKAARAAKGARVRIVADDLSQPIITCKQAKAQGLTRYFSGVRCIHGHIAERKVASGQCVVCADIAFQEWLKANPEKMKAAHKRWVIEQYATNLQYRLRVYLRNGLNTALRNQGGGTRGGSAVRHLGCSITDLIVWLERQFVPGMNRENYNREVWHIDHVVPLSAFDLTDPAQVKLACHYTNLQPMWAIDNLSKGGAKRISARLLRLDPSYHL